MPCHAAIKHVRRALPPRRTRYCIAQPPLDVDEVWTRVGWWTRQTIMEALATLVERGEAEPEIDNNRIAYRQAVPNGGRWWEGN